MKSVEQLDDAEAVYSLYLASEAHADDLDLDDSPALQRVVHDAFESAAGPQAARALMDRLQDDRGAAEIARATLAAVRESREFVPDLAAHVDEMLAEPPQAEKMDMGLSLSLLALGAIAMALMGTLEVIHTEERGPKGSSKRSTQVKWAGSQNIPKLVGAILAKLGVGP